MSKVVEVSNKVQYLTEEECYKKIDEIKENTNVSISRQELMNHHLDVILGDRTHMIPCIDSEQIPEIKTGIFIAEVDEINPYEFLSLVDQNDAVFVSATDKIDKVEKLTKLYMLKCLFEAFFDGKVNEHYDYIDGINHTVTLSLMKTKKAS